jgi:superfamily II DNA/RNA helicase
VEGISSDYEQSKREEIMRDFRANKIRVLIGTDVISRGVDIPEVDLVINFDVPGNAEEYVHRIGRTGRAGAEGVSLTLINPSDMEKFDAIEKLIEKKVFRENLPKSLGEGPEWKVREKRKFKGKKNFRKKN